MQRCASVQCVAGRQDLKNTPPSDLICLEIEDDDAEGGEKEVTVRTVCLEAGSEAEYACCLGESLNSVLGVLTCTRVDL